MRKLTSPTKKELEGFFTNPDFEQKEIVKVSNHYECDCPNNLNSISGNTNLKIMET